MNVTCCCRPHRLIIIDVAKITGRFFTYVSHSKWANIKHKARGKPKIGREIAIAVRDGGSDPTVNGSFTMNRKSEKPTICRTKTSAPIAKAAGELGNVNYEEIQYEGYASGGVAVIVSTVTDNRNRTASDIRPSSDKNGGSWVPMAAFLTCSIVLA